jgi:HD superfamily phosphohydrolase
MQFAYLDDTAGAVDLMVGTLLHSLQQHRNTREQLNEDDIPEVELPEDWKKFQESLQAFQKEYMQTARCVRETEQSLVGKKKKLETLKKLTDTFDDGPYKEEATQLVSKFEQEEDIGGEKEELASLKGTAHAMRLALVNTNPEQALKFQCFVCMDKEIDSFLDPCGHVICTGCWRRNNSAACPGCRTQVTAKKIFTLS